MQMKMLHWTQLGCNILKNDLDKFEQIVVAMMADIFNKIEENDRLKI